MDPLNVDLIQKYEWALDRREQGLFTVPSTIGEEMKYNPFMRCDTDVIRKAVGAEVGDGEGVVADKLRAMKDSF